MKFSKSRLLPFLLLNCAAFGALLPATSNAAAGDIYVANRGDDTISRVTPTGTRTTFASGLPDVYGLAFDHSGNLFFSAPNTGEIYKITPNGTKTLFPSTGINYPRSLAFDSVGNLFVSEGFPYSGNHRILKITPAGVQSVFASQLSGPDGLGFDPAGNLFVADSQFGGTAAVYKFTPAGARSTFWSAPNVSQNQGDLTGLGFAPSGNLYVANTTANSVEKFTPSGTRTTFASGIVAPKGIASTSFVLYAISQTSLFKCSGDGSRSTVTSGLSFPVGLAIEPPRSQPLNIATRLRVQSGDNVLIAGFIVTGTAPKKVLIRGIGPSLASAGISGALQDPIIVVRNSGNAFVNGNNNWKDTNQAAIEATGAAPTDNRESALILTLGPGNWTVTLSGVGNTTGIGVVEIYDLDPAANSRLANISSRGFVETGENAMIGGFIIGSGNGAGRVVVRALGPSLAAVGVNNALADPKLTLRDASGTVIVANDDWIHGQQQEVAATGLAPQNDNESAMVIDLVNGNYTAIVEGYEGGTGVGLVEVYNLR